MTEIAPEDGTRRRVRRTMEITETSWSPAFGMCIDRFGTPWMISANSSQS